MLLLRDIDCICCIKVTVASTAAQAGRQIWWRCGIVSWFWKRSTLADVIGGPLQLGLWLPWLKVIGDKVEQEYEDEAAVVNAASGALLQGWLLTNLTNLTKMKLMLLFLLLPVALSDWDSDCNGCECKWSSGKKLANCTNGGDNKNYDDNRSLGALRAPTSSWRPFRTLDFVLRALRAVRPV